MISVVLLCSVLAAQYVEAPFPRIANCYGPKILPVMRPGEMEEVAPFDLHIGGSFCNWSSEIQKALLHERIEEGRKLNPHLRVLEFSVSAPYADPRDNTFPEDGWLRQPNGSFVDGWPGSRMINLLKEDVLAWLVARCVRSIKDREFDGLFIDCMMPQFDWWACNIRSQEDYAIDADEDGKPDERAWLDAQWTEAKQKLVKRVREAVGSRTLFMVNNGSDKWVRMLNGILLEDDLDYVLDSDHDWEGVLERYLYWTKRCRRPTVTTIVSSSGVEPPFDAWEHLSKAEQNVLLEKGKARLQRMRFGLATTLMGDGYFAYDLHTRWRGQRWWYPEYDAPLGLPTGRATRRPDGAWQRNYDGGTVIVNPTFLDKEIAFKNLRRDVSSGKADRRFRIPFSGWPHLPSYEWTSAGRDVARIRASLSPARRGQSCFTRRPCPPADGRYLRRLQ